MKKREYKPGEEIVVYKTVNGKLVRFIRIAGETLKQKEAK